jgi:hypothetical protein
VTKGIKKMAENYGITEDGLTAKMRKLNNDIL